MLAAVQTMFRSVRSAGIAGTVGTVGMVTAMLTVSAVPADAAALDTQVGIARLGPGPDETVGVAHPLRVTFRAPVTDRAAAERGLRISSTPPMTGRFEWVADDVVHWVPDEFWPGHSRVRLSVRGMSTEFRTGPVVLGVADTKAHTFTVTIDGAEAGPSSLPAPHHRPYRGQEGVFPASMGSADYPTPPGRYTVLAKDRSVLMDSSSVGIPVSSEDGYHFEVEHAVRISHRGLFVHAAPWAMRSMGVENVSHGCVGLSPTDAQWYFDMVSVGDPVVVRD